jgi:hypothetical protein
MIDFMTGVSAEWAVHIMSDSSRRSKAERHGVVCAMWDARTNMPLRCVAGLGTVDSCAGQDKAKVTYEILQKKGVQFEFTPQSGWSFVAITDAAAVALAEMVHVRDAAELKLLQKPPGPVASLRPCKPLCRNESPFYFYCWRQLCRRRLERRASRKSRDGSTQL